MAIGNDWPRASKTLQRLVHIVLGCPEGACEVLTVKEQVTFKNDRDKWRAAINEKRRSRRYRYWVRTH